MEKKYLTDKNYIIIISLFLITGLFMLFLPKIYIRTFHLIISIGMMLIGVLLIIFNIKNKNNIIDYLFSISFLILGYFFFTNSFNLLSTFNILLSAYLILISLIKISTFIVYKLNKTRGFYRLLTSGLIDLLFAIIIITNLKRSVRFLTFIFGLYFIAIAFQYMIDWFFEYHKRDNRNRSFRWTIPTIFSIFIPYTVSTRINRSLTNNQDFNKIDNKVDLEILISVKDSNIGKFGHADFIFNDKVYSYGNYDEDSKKFFDTVGDGTLIVASNKKKYINFCIDNSKKTFFDFGISLTDIQKQKVEEKINAIMNDTYLWKCKQELNPKEEYTDYGSKLWRNTKCKYYKFNSKSKYKTYYVMWTNCVKVIDEILRVTGSPIIRLNGVITPGTYYYFLNEEYNKKNSNVISKKVIGDFNKDTL